MNNVINHNSNVMRIKKNVFDKIFNMVMNVKRKNKGQYES
jgi:predicted amino acid-binding ACT domain protein